MGSIAPIGPYSGQVQADLGTTYTDPLHPGITPALSDELKTLAQKYALGIYDLNQGPLRAPTDVHRQGKAADVDTINGVMVDGTLTPLVQQFSLDALANPATRIGAFPSLLKFLQSKGFGSRVVPDSPDHIHVDVASGAAPNAQLSASGGGDPDPYPVNGTQLQQSLWFARHPQFLLQPNSVSVNGKTDTVSSAFGLDAQFWKDVQFNFYAGAVFLAIIAGGFALLASSAPPAVKAAAL